jgi:AraC-like DNA-binding protein
MLEEGVTVINGTDINASIGSVGSVKSASRSPSPESRKSANGDEDKEKDKDKPKKFQNGWSKEQERLMAEWSDIAACYRWLHNQSNKVFHVKTLWINLPVIVLSTLGGTASFGIQSLFEGNESAKKYASFGIGGISLLAGLLTTVGNYLRKRRLSIALEKLQKTRIGILEIALSCRYETQESFTRAFKSHFGVNPGQVRKGYLVTKSIAYKARLTSEYLDFLNGKSIVF